MVNIALRYDLRAPAGGSVTHADMYRACLEQCAWADEHGFDVVVLSEHHGVDDGYLPAPLTLAGVIIGRTQRLAVNIAAVLLPMHDPVRIAEQLAVLDLAGGGRVTFVAGLGYRAEELEMAGIEPKDRGRLLEEYVEVMRRAWTGEPFEWRGRTIRVTPRPLTQPHPVMMIGGSTEVAARRAARLRCGFFPAVGDPALATAYDDEAARVGFTEGFCSLPSGLGMVHVAEDPDAAWARIAPHAVYDAHTYMSWQTGGQRSAVHVEAPDADGVRASGVYRVVTPDECVELAAEIGDFGTLLLHPLMGGMPIDLGWESLELFAAKVLPRLRPPEI
ncbi:MAG: LLM class flavin-dependent oxidoreductase [Actinomycetota bacterium]|nr:LLM class flavin-dependent oxidoreductase [Actinomycetota bacterium]